MFRTGVFITFFAILVGFLVGGGRLGILFQFTEWMIILGCASGNFIVANPKFLLKSAFLSIKKTKKQVPYTKADYLQLLNFMFNFFKHSNASSLAELESHIENPKQSELFQRNPVLLMHEDALTFFCDYFRIITLGFDESHEIDNMMEHALNEKRISLRLNSEAFIRLGDAMPAIGIIAAVLGVITAMGAVDSSPAVLGAKVASAMTGTFAGVMLSYCVVTPLGQFLEKYEDREIKFLECIKIAIISYMNGYPPSISVEFARQGVPIESQPTFYELEGVLHS